LSLYVYLVLSTTTVFVILGWLFGRKEDLLRETAATDSLTGLSNRRHFDARLAEELERAVRYRTPLSLLVIDVDGLRAINDRRGHEGGDLALRAVGQALRSTCRATDLGARTGGDEFAVLAPMTKAADALGLADRIRAAIATEPLAPTVSIGVADLELAGVGSLHAAADRALYHAKSTGRDRAELAEPPSGATRNALDGSALECA
jgi:diguanylate cyclase (GGDEF)-like protein